MDDKKEYIQTVEEEISLDNYPFVKIGCIIGFTYGLILLISYIVLIHILKIYSLKPIFYIAVDIDIIFALLYAIYAVFVLFDMTERAAKKLKKEESEKVKNSEINKKQNE
jgi:hypothetical protein